MSKRIKLKFADQLGFIKRSAEDFDRGADAEAFRIAVALRVLFHNTKMSTSIAHHLRMEKWKMLTTSTSKEHMAYISIEMCPTKSPPLNALPRLGNKFYQTTVNEWWSESPVFTAGSKTFTRKEIVLAAANKDGGAHVDDVLDPFYEELSNGIHALGIEWVSVPQPRHIPYDHTVTQYTQRTHLALLRQFGHEVMSSAQHYKWLKMLGVHEHF